MLSTTLKDADGFIANQSIYGALFKVDLTSLSDGALSTRGFNRLLDKNGIKFADVTYVNPRADCPCMYGCCVILNKRINLESNYSWSDFKRLKRSHGGVLCVVVKMEDETSFLPRLTVSLEIEEPGEDIVMSPILNILNTHKKSA